MNQLWVSISLNAMNVRQVMMNVSWKVVFHFPSLSAARTTPLSTAICLRPVTMNSLPMMTHVTQTGQSPLELRLELR